MCAPRALVPWRRSGDGNEIRAERNETARCSGLHRGHRQLPNHPDRFINHLALNDLHEWLPCAGSPWHSRCDWPTACRGKRRAHLIKHAALPQLRTASGRCSTSGEDLMSMLVNYVKSFARQEEGQDLLEYALLVALIALIAIGAVGAAGTSVSTIFQSIADQLAAAV
jgi:pilus assembly protein Flp/PilA